jgi:HSP20 family protein
MTTNTELVKHESADGAPQRLASPAADIFETPEAYVIMLDMPGASKDSIRITLEKHELIVRAEIAPRHSQDASVLVNEIFATGYARSFNLGDGIDREKVDAEFALGVLTVKLHKSEDWKRKEITVH